MNLSFTNEWVLAVRKVEDQVDKIKANGVLVIS